MAYVSPNFKTKKAFKEHVAAGKAVDVYQPGMGGPIPKDGKVCIEGPHYPEPHRWYAEVSLQDGKVTKVT